MTLQLEQETSITVRTTTGMTRAPVVAALMIANGSLLVFAVVLTAAAAVCRIIGALAEPLSNSGRAAFDAMDRP